MTNFNEYLNVDDILNKFVDKVFWIWDENYFLQV